MYEENEWIKKVSKKKIGCSGEGNRCWYDIFISILFFFLHVIFIRCRNIRPKRYKNVRQLHIRPKIIEIQRFGENNYETLTVRQERRGIEDRRIGRLADWLTDWQAGRQARRQCVRYLPMRTPASLSHHYSSNWVCPADIHTHTAYIQTHRNKWMGGLYL